MEIERIEIIVLLESIKENILHNPNKGIWTGIVLCNSREYHWRITERPIEITIEEKQ